MPNPGQLGGWQCGTGMLGGLKLGDSERKACVQPDLKIPDKQCGIGLWGSDRRNDSHCGNYGDGRKNAN